MISPGKPVNSPEMCRIHALLSAHGDAWLALAYSCCGDFHHAEDAVVEALANLEQAFLKGGVDNPSAWMETAVRRRGADRSRKEGAQRNLLDRLARETSSKPDYSSELPLPPDPDDLPVAVADSCEPFIAEPHHWQAVEDALPDLPERQREVIRLRLFEKLSPAEIAGRP